MLRCPVSGAPCSRSESCAEVGGHMASFKISSGSTSAIVSGDMRKYVERVLNETQDATVREMRAATEEVRASARAAWYQQVTERSGRSGDIRTAITIDPELGNVSVSVGSVDTRRSKEKPTVVFVHAPFPGSLQQTLVSEEEYIASPEHIRAWIDHKKTKYFVWKPPKQPATGKYLLETLVKAPMRAKLKQLSQSIQDRAAKAAGGSSG